MDKFDPIKKLFWISFGLSLFILLNNFGLGLIGFGIVIVPALVIHFMVGRKLEEIRKQKILIIWSSINLLLFSLARPDGVHVLGDSGLSALLNLFGFSTGLSAEDEGYYIAATMILFLSQLATDFFLLKKVAKKQLVR